ncbi:MAG: hypothetical protein N3A69_18255, partial [Leptospiraceae bacterium]|nr:hypothetical protein [Leptospiraceae bacterium]
MVSFFYRAKKLRIRVAALIRNEKGEILLVRQKKNKKDYLKNPVEHVDIKKIDAIPIIEMYSKMSFSARTLAYGAFLYE